MELHGQNALGVFGILSEADITALIENHIGDKLNKDQKTAAMRLASAFGSHNGVAGAGSGAISEWKYQGATVFHRTALGGSYTLFFYCSVAGTQMGGICGIGTHRTSDTYDMVWRKHNWGSAIVNI